MQKNRFNNNNLSGKIWTLQGFEVLAMLVAGIMGALFSILLAFAAIKLKADQTLIGTAMNMLGTAAATVIAKSINLAEDSTKPDLGLQVPCLTQPDCQSPRRPPENAKGGRDHSRPPIPILISGLLRCH